MLDISGQQQHHNHLSNDYFPNFAGLEKLEHYDICYINEISFIGASDHQTL